MSPSLYTVRIYPRLYARLTLTPQNLSGVLSWEKRGICRRKGRAMDRALTGSHSRAIVSRIIIRISCYISSNGKDGRATYISARYSSEARVPIAATVIVCQDLHSCHDRLERFLQVIANNCWFENVAENEGSPFAWPSLDLSPET